MRKKKLQHLLRTQMRERAPKTHRAPHEMVEVSVRNNMELVSNSHKPINLKEICNVCKYVNEEVHREGVEQKGGR